MRVAAVLELGQEILYDTGSLPPARGEQPDIAVIFRGTGKKIPQAEKDMYADGVKVYWQKKVSRL